MSTIGNLGNAAAGGLLLCSFLLTAGCATIASDASAIQGASALHLVLRDYDKSGLNLPLGGHRVPDTPFAVFQLIGQGGGYGAAAFGIVGLGVLHGAKAGQAEKLASAVAPSLAIDLKSQTEALLRAEAAKRESLPAFSAEAIGSGTTLTVMPYGWFLVGPEKLAELDLFLEVAAKAPGGSTRFKRTYAYYASERHPLSTESGGWGAEGGRPLADTVEDALHALSKALLDDFDSTIDRASRRAETVRFRIGVLDQKLKSRVVLRTEEEKRVCVEVQNSLRQVFDLPRDQIEFLK